MTNGPAYFEIQADDVDRAAGFYSLVFGWKFTKDENLPIDYRRIDASGARGGLLKRPVPGSARGSGTNAFTCSMEVADFDATAAMILENGGDVAMAKFAVPGVCWQGYFLDPENNVFGLFQPDPNAA